LKHLLYLPILCFSIALSQDATVSRDEITYTFTNCGQTGQTGPSQSQCNSAYSSTNLNGQVTVNGGIQEWIGLPGVYSIEINGAEGSYGQGGSGGQGARMIGEFIIPSSTSLQIVVGQMGTYGGNSEPGGGGGGSFVYTGEIGGSGLFIAAGGGGGGGEEDAGSGYQGVDSEQGTTYNGSPSGTAGYGGTNGGDGGPGAGWYSDGSGAYAGARWNGGCGSGCGGFGGGGGGKPSDGGGCGGGYSGGSSSSPKHGGGGGGSYNASTILQDNASGANTGHGQVVISYHILPPLISNPQSANYSNVPFNNTYDMTFELINYNETPTIVDSIKIGSEEGGIDETPQFQVIGSDSFTIEPDSTHNLTIRYFPHLNELYTEDLSGITSSVWFYNESDAEDPIYNGLSLSANSFVNLSASPGDHTFTDIPLGTFLEQDIDFTNTSGSVQEITDILPGYFDYSDSSFVELSEFSIINETQYELNPGETQTITLRYSPEDVGSDDAFLYSFSPDYISHIMPISGSSILPTVTIEPDTLDFGSVQVGAFEEVEISVYPDFSVGAVDVVDVNTTSSVFTIVSDTAFTILPEEVVPITVSFNPEAQDTTYVGTLEIVYSVGDTTIVLGSSVLTGSSIGVIASNFQLISPILGFQGVPVYTQFNWESAFGSATGNYLLRYGTVIGDIINGVGDTYTEVAGISGNSYFVEEDLNVGILIYWTVWAENPDGSLVQALLQNGQGNNASWFIVEPGTPELNGPILGTRTLRSENSPYYVTGDVEILENNKLTIPAGVEIRFHSEGIYYEIVVGGELRALGTAEEPVFFHSDISSTI